MATWINEANWPEAWSNIYFSPIVKEGDDNIVYATGAGVLKIYKYNLTLQAWTYLTTTPAQFYGALSMSVDETKLAGHEANGRRLYILDIAALTWTTSGLTPVITPTGENANVQSTGWSDDDTVWCQVRDDMGNLRTKAYKYVISTDTWSQGANRYSGFGNGVELAFNTAKTIIYFGKGPITPKNTGVKYVIATDTYTDFLCGPSGSYDFVMCAPRGPILLLLDALTSYTGYHVFDCDTETFNPSTAQFPDDQPTRNHVSSTLPAGLHDLGLIIAYHYTTAEPHDRSYMADVLATVTTDPASLVGKEDATINGTLDDNGGSVCDCGFEWGLTVLYGNSTATQSKTTGESFAVALSGLDKNVTYHFRSFAINAAGKANGADETFKTLGGAKNKAIIIY